MNRLTLAIAAYQIESFIAECLDSVRAQTCQDFNLLVIDDGSRDQTGKILDHYAEKYPKMRLVHQKNGGISRVRNAMIDTCETEYLWMIDGDDTLPADAVERLLPTLDGKREAVYFTYSCYGEADKRALSGAICDLTQAQICALRYKCMLNDPEPRIQQINANSSVMCAYLVATLRSNNLSFEIGRKSGEDAMFTAAFLRAATQLAYLDASLYVYRVNEGSVSLRYHKGMTQANLEWIDVLKAYVDQYYAEDAHMHALLAGRILGTAGSSIFLEICHPHNPDSYFARRKQFRALARNPEVVKAIRACPNELIRRNVKIFRLLMRFNLFLPTDLFAHLVMHKRYIVFRSHGGRVRKL